MVGSLGDGIRKNLQIHTTVVLAMSADGKIANSNRSPARFGSAKDQDHLETQISRADGVIFGAGTLRAYGTTMVVKQPALLEHRAALGKPPQPVHIVASRRGNFEANLRFFSQPVPRWLITTVAPDPDFSLPSALPFEKVIVAPQIDTQINWLQAFEELATLGIKKLIVSGGGELVAALIALDLVDELWLTVCPLILGGREAPSPVAGLGLTEQKQLQLLTAEVIGAEVFLHYRLIPQPDQELVKLG